MQDRRETAETALGGSMRDRRHRQRYAAAAGSTSNSTIIDLGNNPEELPTVSNVLIHFALTAGKAGGLQPTEPAPIG